MTISRESLITILYGANAQNSPSDLSDGELAFSNASKKLFVGSDSDSTSNWIGSIIDDSSSIDWYGVTSENNKLSTQHAIMQLFSSGAISELKISSKLIFPNEDGSYYSALQGNSNASQDAIYILPASIGSVDQVLKISSISGSEVSLSWGTSTGGSGTPGGSDTYVQFNDGGSFGGDSGITYNKTTDALSVAGDINANGGAVKTIATTFSLADATATTINFGGSATSMNIGSTTGSTTIKSPTLVGSQSTQALYDTVATTMNFARTATLITMGSTTGTTAIRNPILRLGSTTGVIATNTTASTNHITLQPCGELSITPTTTLVNAGSIPSLTVENTDGATGVVEISGGNLFLGRKTADDAVFTSVDIVFEGAASDAFETTLTVADPTADRTITLPDASGTVGLVPGNNTEVVYNNNGALGSSSLFIYDSASNILEVDGGHVRSSLLGAVQIEVRNTTGSPISAGTPVYAVGYSGVRILIAPADASDSSRMPAVGIVDGAISNNSNGHATVTGVLRNINTTSYSVNQTLYVASGGGLTNVRPTSASVLVQNMGKVVNVGVNGEVVVFGPGRTNDVPNQIIVNDTIIFEGATANDYETTLAVTDPTADRTITFPDSTGTVALVAGSDTYVMFNDGGSALGGDSGLTYNKTTDTLTVSGDLAVNGGDITTTASGTFNIVNSNATGIYMGNNDATDVRIGKTDSTGTNRLYGTTQIVGGTLTTGAATSYLFNTTSTTLAIGGAASLLTLGYDSTGSSTTNISNGTVGSGSTKTVNIGTGGGASSTTNINIGSSIAGTVTINSNVTASLDLAVNGGDITTTASSATVMNSNASTLSIGGAATSLTVGATTGTAYLRNPLFVLGSTAVGISTNSGTSNYISFVPYGNFTISPLSTGSTFGGTSTSLNVTNGVDATGVVSVSGGDLYLGTKQSDEFSPPVSVNIIFEGSSNDGFETTLTITNPTADRTITLPNLSGTAIVNSNKLSDLSSTTSAELASVISDETGTGVLVFGTSPEITTSLTTSSSTFSLVNTNATTVNFAGAATSLTIGSTSGTTIIRNDLQLNAQSDLRFADSDSSHYVSFQAPSTVLSNITWTLPSTDGSSGQLLSTNGSGTLSWTSDEDLISCYIDGTPDVISTGVKAFKVIPYDCEVVAWYVISNSSGSMQWDVSKADFATYPTTTSIVSLSDYPDLVSQSKNSNTSVSGWTAIDSGDIVEFEVTSNADVQNVGIFLKIRRI